MDGLTRTIVARTWALTRQGGIALLFVGLVAGCGSSAGATQGPSSNSPVSGATPPAVAATSETGGGGGGGGSGSGNLSVDAVAQALVPPHSTEITKTTATDTWFAMYTSTDSVDSLRAFYEAAIARAGLRIFSTTTVQGGVGLVMATDESASFGGAVNIFPTGDGTTSVQVTVGKS